MLKNKSTQNVDGYDALYQCQLARYIQMAVVQWGSDLIHVVLHFDQPTNMLQHHISQTKVLLCITF